MGDQCVSVQGVSSLFPASACGQMSCHRAWVRRSLHSMGEARISCCRSTITSLTLFSELVSYVCHGPCGMQIISGLRKVYDVEIEEGDAKKSDTTEDGSAKSNTAESSAAEISEAKNSTAESGATEQKEQAKSTAPQKPRKFRQEGDFVLDFKSRQASLTEAGLSKVHVALRKQFCPTKPSCIVRAS